MLVHIKILKLKWVNKMNKQIFSIGYDIPGKSECYKNFNSKHSLMDTDILLICPESFTPTGDWVNFTTSDGGCYNVEASSEYEKRIFHFKKEITDFLNTGKNLFIFLSEKKNYRLTNNVTSPRKGQNTYDTYYFINYNFLPFELGKLISASGKHIVFTGYSVFSEFYKLFSKNLTYKLYIEEPNHSEIVFTGKDKKKILGAVYKAGKGHIIALPYLMYDEEQFTEYDDEGETYWTDEATIFGNQLLSSLLNIDQQLSNNSDKMLI